jgi:mRNA interferase MazF
MKIIEIRKTQTTVLVAETDKPPRKDPRIKAAPKIRQLYWCDFPKDAQLPEFWKTRAVLIMSFRNSLHGAVTVLPCSGQDQGDNKWAYKLPVTIDGAPSWAICDKPTSIAVSRLSTHRTGIVRLSEAEFNPVLDMMLTWLTPGKTIGNPP